MHKPSRTTQGDKAQYPGLKLETIIKLKLPYNSGPSKLNHEIPS